MVQVACKLQAVMIRDGEEVSRWGGGADIECHQKSSVFKYISSEQWRSQGRISGGQNRVAPGRAQEVKQRVASGAGV